MLAYREVRVHAILAATVLWVAAGIFMFATPGYRSLTGRLKGGDFIHLYSLGHFAFKHEYPTVANADTLHTLQVELLPASEPEFYYPVYPPQTALVFAPFALLPYEAAAGLWTLVLVCVYAMIVWYTWRTVQDVVPDKIFVVAAAAAFPPFWSLVLHSQTTIFPLAAFFLAWLALEHRRPFAAGCALGLLAIKPQFALVVAVVVLATRQWASMLGAICAVAVQILGVIVVMGPGALAAYLATLKDMPAIEPLLDPHPWQTHSLRSLTRLLPGAGGLALWLCLSAAVTVIVVKVWRTATPLAARLAVLVLATVLVSPHVLLYDAVVLVLPILWLAGWIERQRPMAARRFWWAVYGLALLLLVPTAKLVYLQGSVILMVAAFWQVSRLMCTQTDGIPELSIRS